MIAAVIGGRDRHPSLAEMERVVAELGPEAVRVLRHSTATAPGKQGTERLVARYVKARELAVIEPWPSRTAAILGDLAHPQADLVIALDGGKSTQAATILAEGRGIPIVRVEPVAETKLWNRHHGEPPGPWFYIGRGSPLGNPHLDLGGYKRWLWARLNPKSRDFDPAVLAAIDAFTPKHFAVCSCHPNPCHGGSVIAACRWRNSQARREVERA
jgi:hypothetical protein